MKNTKKIIITLLVIVSMLFVATTFSQAAEYGATMKLKSSTNETKVGDTVTFTLYLDSVTNVEGVATVHAKINYDKTILELISCEATNSWSAPVYNSQNQEFVTERAEVMPKGGEILKIKFKVLTLPKNNEAMVSITNFDVADTENQITVSDTNLKLSIKENGTNPEKPNGGNNTNNSTNTNNGSNNSVNGSGSDKNESKNSVNKVNTTNKDNSIAKSKLPKAGNSKIIPILIVITIMAVVILYLKNKKHRGIK